ncbi:hypothetical protein QNI16_10220 [Cytophagaceae bacterium YF14B1]|uniref:HTH luxR-type domain-containing protein n=1 Tax=Xanthocytophaga flava TaxID=3048013 RepID=A0AAE3U860_9BACT|nr:hypothetical protein [Xanthocytophaga flavus]MDJ1480858.1 hypothetical protein [Xanthocytophaga flavus]
MNSIHIKSLVNKYLLGVSVAIIILLLSANIVVSYHSTHIMQQNRQLQEQTEEVKKAVFQSLYLIHNADLALRGYVAFKDPRYLPPLQFAYEDKDSIFKTIEVPLRKQNYSMIEFDRLKDSINTYLDQCTRMKDLFDRNQLKEFTQLAKEDKGYHLWLQYDRFNKAVCLYEDTINEQAQQRYNKAQDTIHLVQFMLALLSVPTLLFTAFHTYKQVATAKKLRDAEWENARLLAGHNEKLEAIVQERTEQILIRKQELKAQYEQICLQNEELSRQREELARQNLALTEAKRQQLEVYTQSIMEKNEIIEVIQNKLEQFKSIQQVDYSIIENFNTILKSSILTEESWQKFKTTFEAIYPHFFATLRFHYPHITSAEQRLAALIKLNLSVKECANMLGISPESVKKSRQRLRKRLQLTESENIDIFIQEFLTTAAEVNKDQIA